MTGRQLLQISAAAVAMLFASVPSRAETKAEIDVAVSAAMSRFYAQDHANRELVSKAAGVLVFPHITKGGIGVAGEYGEGALRVGGHTVAYYSIGAASVGATVGVGQHSEVLLFMTQEALDGFRKSHGWTVGADAQVALVSKGAGAQYDNATLRRPILAFVFGEKGLIGDISIEGAKITMKAS